MKTNIEKPKNTPPIQPSQLDLDLQGEKTTEQIIESIRNKRQNGIPLSDEEIDLVNKETEEDREERNNMYPH